MKYSITLALVFLGASVSSTLAVNEKIVCYLGSWANYRPGDGKFEIESIDPRLCTHLIYTFIGLDYDTTTIKILDPWLDLGLHAYERLKNLKRINPNLKNIIAIGGWNEGSERYSEMAADPAKRQLFVENALNFTTFYGFDGFDLDWEYPNQRGGKPEDKDNYVLLLKEMHEAFNPHGLELSAAVGASHEAIELSYHVSEVNKYLDTINVMTYDLNGPWNDFTGHNAPLRTAPEDVLKNLSVVSCIQGWLDAGATKDKLVLGMPVYGHTFTLANPEENGLGAKTYGPGLDGPITNQPGMLGYNEICTMKLREDWVDEYNEEHEAPHATYGENQWVGYDDADSIAKKVKYAKELGLAGVMIWSIETDDFHGICGTKYPILFAINKELGNEIPTTTAAPTTPTTPTKEPPTGPPSKFCDHVGLSPDPEDCSKYINCVADGKGGFIRYDGECPDTTLFDPILLSCNFAEQVKCLSK